MIGTRHGLELGLGSGTMINSWVPLAGWVTETGYVSRPHFPCLKNGTISGPTSWDGVRVT